MRVLIHTDVVMDLLLDRKPYSQDAAKCFSKVETGEIEGLLCASTVTTVYYLISKALGARKAKDIIALLLSFFEVAPVNQTVLKGALDLSITDFENAVLHEAAHLANVELIITRNTSGFKESKIPVQLPG